MASRPPLKRKSYRVKYVPPQPITPTGDAVSRDLATGIPTVGPQTLAEAPITDPIDYDGRMRSYADTLHAGAQQSQYGYDQLAAEAAAAEAASLGIGEGGGGSYTGGRGGPSIQERAGAAYRAGFRGEALITMVAISLSEAGEGSNAFNGNAGSGDKSYGYWQINMLGSLGPARRKQWGLKNDEELFDPDVNARAAFSLGGGGKTFQPWSDYKNGRYKKFMAAVRADLAGNSGYKGNYGGEQRAAAYYQGSPPVKKKAAPAKKPGAKKKPKSNVEKMWGAVKSLWS